MTLAASRALAVARPVVRTLIVLDLIYGLLLVALLVFSFTIEDWPKRPLGFEMVNQHPYAGDGLRAIVLIGVIGAAVMYAVLRRLAAIVDTVRDGDPFTLENSLRLNQIAWRVGSLELLRLVVAAIAWAVWKPWKVDAFSFASWLSVLLLFVLAGVFAHGTRLRDDLAGTV